MLSHKHSAGFFYADVTTDSHRQEHITVDHCQGKRNKKTSAFACRSLKECSHSRSTHTAARLHPVLEYTSFVWNPYRNLTNSLESVPRKENLPILRPSSSYSRLISDLFQPLEERMIAAKTTVILYKVMNGLVDLELYI